MNRIWVENTIVPKKKGKLYNGTSLKQTTTLFVKIKNYCFIDFDREKPLFLNNKTKKLLVFLYFFSIFFFFYKPICAVSVCVQKGSGSQAKRL